MSRVQLLDARRERSRIAEIWRTLELACRPRYFLSWAWIETWLDTLPRRAQPQLAVAVDGKDPVAAFFVASRATRRHGWLSSRAVFVNETGAPEHDVLHVEHNGWLCRPDASLDAAAVLEALPLRWDELTLNALDRDGWPGRDLVEAGDRFHVRVVAAEPAPHVDLHAVRERGYLALLSDSTRAAIRRSARAYEQRGALVLEPARRAAQALGFFDELAELSKARFGNSSAFGSAYFRRFHQTLIRRRFDHGEVQLLRLRAGADTVGLAYNLVQHGVVHFYQCGLRYEGENRYKPGLLLHANAIEHNAAAGHTLYDFLGGDARYKHELSTSATPLVWLRVQRPLAKYALETHLRRVRDWGRQVQAQLRSISVSP